MPTNMPTAPAMGDFKKQQSSLLADLIPQIMNALGGGDHRTEVILANQRARNQERVDGQNLRGFMRSIMSPSTGKITPQLLMEQAELWGVDPGTAMNTFGAFQKFRQGGQQELFKNYNKDGTFTWQPKIAGASGTEMPSKPVKRYASSKLGVLDTLTGKIVSDAPEVQPALQRVPDGKGGWQFVRPKEGLAGLNNPGKGMRIEAGPNGTVVQTNVPSNGGVLTPSTKSQVQKGLLEAVDTYDGLRSAWGRYDDSFLKGKDKLGFNITAFKEKWDLGKVSPEEKAKLEDYTKFKRDSISSLNNYIKQVTGAAMSVDEAKRLMKGMPNPGMGMFDGDSPTEFKAKMNATMQQLGRVVARAKYILNSDLGSFADVSLEQMDGIIDARGEELEKSLKDKYPDKPEKDITLLVTHALSEEFGVGI